MAVSGRHASASSGSPQKKFERPPHFQKLLYTDILQSQQTDTNGELADALLICDGGTIRVHAFILQGASPFLQNMIASQGENYPYIREILLPDFPVKEIERMLCLIYKGYVNLRSNKDAERLKGTLKFFQIAGVDFSSEKFEKITGSLKVQELNRIPQDILKCDVRNGASDEYKPKVVVTPVSDQQQVRRSGRTPKPIMALDKDAAEGGDDPDFMADSRGESSNEEASGDESSSRKRARRPRTEHSQPVVKLARIGNTGQKAGTSSAIANTRPTFSNLAGTNSHADKEDSGTDTEDEGWKKPNFKDKDWFYRESRRCQTCNKTYPKPAEASLCITSHKSLRCYFCFEVYTTTDILFKHFRRRHKQAGRENTLICPFCDQAIPYKSVSCHVISVHLRTKPDTEQKPKSTTASPSTTTIEKGAGRSSTAVTPSTGNGHLSRRRSRSVSTERLASSSSERNPPKRSKNVSTPPSVSPQKKKKGKQLKLSDMRKMLKTGDSNGPLQVPDLDVTLEKVMSNGQTLIFRLQKKRFNDDNPVL